MEFVIMVIMLNIVDLMEETVQALILKAVSTLFH